MKTVVFIFALGFMLATGVSGAEFGLLASQQLTPENLAGSQVVAFDIRTRTPFNATCFDVTVTPKDTGSVAYVMAHWDIGDKQGYSPFGTDHQRPTVDEGCGIEAYHFGYGVGRDMPSKSRVWFEYWTNSPNGPARPDVGPDGFIFNVRPRFPQSQIYGGYKTNLYLEYRTNSTGAKGAGVLAWFWLRDFTNSVSPNPGGGANGRQPAGSAPNRTSAAAASRRSP